MTPEDAMSEDPADRLSVYESFLGSVDALAVAEGEAVIDAVAVGIEADSFFFFFSSMYLWYISSQYMMS